MEVRVLRESEKEEYAYMIKQAFQLPQPSTDYFMQNESVDNMWGIFDGRKRMLAGLRILRNRLWLGAQPVEMVGITSVATPPEYRRQGQLKELLQTVLTTERAQGRNVSSLYPFDYPFYRKFGYELAGSLAKTKVQIGAMSHFKRRTAGEWQRVQAEDWAEFRTLYDRFCVGKFGRIERASEAWWRKRIFTVLSHQADRPQDLYLWRDSEGTARAYLVYSLESINKDNPWERQLNVRDMVWLDEAARHEIYAFIANHDSQVMKATWDAEPGDEFLARLNDPYQAEIKLESGFMLRLLDVAHALTERAWPTDSKAAFSLSVQDEMFEWNHNRTWRVAVEDGHASVTEATTDEQTGLTCDVRTLAQLYSGYLSPRQAVRLGKLSVNQPADLVTAQNLFSPPDQPASYMADFW